MDPKHKYNEDPGLWAILPEALAAHIEAEVRHLRTEGPEAIEQFGGVITPPLSPQPSALSPADVARLAGDDGDEYTLRGNIAVVPISGTLTQKGSWRSPMTYAEAAKALLAAAEEPRAAAVLALVDSPGGTVAGVTELVDAVREVGEKKPLYAYTDGLLASGAYWPMAGARKIGAVSTAQVGSIGVLTAHEDMSKMLERWGLKVTFLTSGKYKAMGNPVEPLTEDARAYIQDRIDAIYSLFLADVAAGRALSVDDAERWADGRVFPAAAAVGAGLIDRVESLTSFIKFIQEDISMKPSDVKAQHPDTYRAIHEEGMAAAKAETQAATEAARKTAADEAKQKQQAETVAMVTALFGQAAADKLAGVLKTGVTAEQLAAMKAAGLVAGNDTAADNADAASRQTILDGLAGATPPPVNPGADDGAQAGSGPTGAYEAAVKEKMAGGMTRPQAAKAVAKENPELARKWIAVQQRN